MTPIPLVYSFCFTVAAYVNRTCFSQNDAHPHVVLAHSLKTATKGLRPAGRILDPMFSIRISAAKAFLSRTKKIDRSEAFRKQR
jgi:hypothetical protein